MLLEVSLLLTTSLRATSSTNNIFSLVPRQVSHLRRGFWSCVSN